jgi:hypothetical protein
MDKVKTNTKKVFIRTFGCQMVVLLHVNLTFLERDV